MAENGEALAKRLEQAARLCYKSEDKITADSYIKFIKLLINRGHEAMLEHAGFSVKFICDRGVSHEIVRHRIASFAQESTRYCNYSNDKFGSEITVIEPCFWPKDSANYNEWLAGCRRAEEAYFKLLAQGATPQEARAVLPTGLKTELLVTTNLREWRHFFKLRTASDVHPQMLELTRPLLTELKELIPIVFDDIVF
ncbi:MAG: FAD-dependent thymidylate synthase [Spirochaetaceae bacterium]|nr:FAD-dependent thymidylate synthase [Spirochaetaceae bacterium]